MEQLSWKWRLIEWLTGMRIVYYVTGEHAEVHLKSPALLSFERNRFSL